MSTKIESVAVFGAGPAGLATALTLQELGHDVTVIDRSKKPQQGSLYTTNRAVPANLSGLLMPDGATKRLSTIRTVTPRVDFRVETNGNPYFMVDYAKATTHGMSAFEARGGEVIRVSGLGVSQMDISDGEKGVTIDSPNGRRRFDAAVDATGTGAQIINRFSPDSRRHLVEYVIGANVDGDMDDEMALVIGPAHGTSWVNPGIEGGVDVVHSIYASSGMQTEYVRSGKGYWHKLLGFVRDIPDIDIRGHKPTSFYAGTIREEPRHCPTTNRVYPVGAAAGMSPPGSGDDYRNAIIGGHELAHSLHQGMSPQEHYNQWSREWWKKCGLLYDLTVMRLDDQRIGKLGGLSEVIGNAVTANKSRTGDVERYIIDGKMSPWLWFQVFRNREFINALCRVGVVRAKRMAGLSVLPKDLPLPDFVD